MESDGKAFGIIFLVMWGGSFVVTINTKLLGGRISFFQCVGVLGYCILPIVIAAAAVYLLGKLGITFILVKVGIAGVALVWSTMSIANLIFRLYFIYECDNRRGQKYYRNLSRLFVLSFHRLVCDLYLI